MPRLDEELVSQGLCPDAKSAERLILAGLVSNSSECLTSPGRKVARGEPLHVKGSKRYVSRGGLKLEGALDAFGLDVRGLSCVDVGASTGGFTDCLLQHGAASVLAVDVGYGQFDWGLRNDSRVELLERTNAKALADDPLRSESADLVAMDVSFASAAGFASLAAYLLAPGGRLVCLVKPQFEAEPGAVGKGGVVRDEAVREGAVTRVREALGEHGLEVAGVAPSLVRGAKGNQEYLLLAVKRQGSSQG